jgi:molybdate transport system substrate-binding protein
VRGSGSLPRSWVGPAVCALLSIAACGGAGGDAPAEGPILVFAASDLRDAFEELVELHRARGGPPLELVLGSTGNLTSQIENGAPADLFFAANESFLDRLDTAGRVVPGTRRTYALGRLALVWREGAPDPGRLEALGGDAWPMVSIANPEHAPYGVAAREALQSLGLWEGVSPRLVLAENVAQALQFVQTGNADAGIVALGLVRGRVPRPHHAVPAELHAPLRQAAGILADGPRRHRAGEFLDLVMSPEGQEILQRYGFEAPGPGHPAAPGAASPPAVTR